MDRKSQVGSRIHAHDEIRVSGSIRTKTYSSAVRMMFQILVGSQMCQGIWTLREAPRHEVIVMLANFPEKGGSTEERRVRKPLKRRNLLSASFPKRPLLGRVRCSFARNPTCCPGDTNLHGNQSYRLFKMQASLADFCNRVSSTFVKIPTSY